MTDNRKGSDVIVKTQNRTDMFTESEDKKGERGELKEVQRKVDRWIQEIGGGYFSELTNMALLTEEVGEVARIVARLYGDQVAKEGDLRKSLGEELADVLWVVVCLANQTGIDLGEAFAESLHKKETRDAHRFKKP